jgi:DNA-binding LacI/PurR family transcriptional regulator
MRRRVDGLVIVSLIPDDTAAVTFIKNGLPAVLVDAYSPFLTSLVVNNVDGAYMAVNSLIEKGHHRIGFINGITEGTFKFNQANDRLIGVHRALGEAGIMYDPELMITAEWNRAGGQIATKELLSLANPPTAIFAASDLQAIGVLEAARNLGLNVPEELSVIGFDGIELSEIMELSTIQQPMQQMGEMGVACLMELVENPQKSPELIRLDTKLIERRTTTVPKQLLSIK